MPAERAGAAASGASRRAAGIVLAAGAGRRFGGGVKQLAPLRGRPLLQHAVDAMLAATGVERVVVVLGHAAGEVRGALTLGAAEVVLAPDWANGQSASLKRGVAAIGDADAAVVTLGDQPLITARAIDAALARLDGGCDAVRSIYGGVPGHPVVLGRAVLDAVPSLSGDAGARQLLARFRVRSWDASAFGDAADVDTREQLAAL